MDLKESVLNYKVLLLLIMAISFFSCNKNNATEDSIENVGKGKGQIEFQGKTYPLNECSSYKMASGIPLSLGFHFYYTEDGKYADHVIDIAIPSYVYDTWSTLELPAGTHNNISFEFRLNNYETQGWNLYEGGIFETKLEVKKTDNDYEIVFTGKARLYLEDNSLHDFKMAWIGKIPKAKEDNYISPR